MTNGRILRSRAIVVLAGLFVLVLSVTHGAQTQNAPKYKFDPDWPKPLPNNWKMGGVTGLAVDKDDNVWVLDRPKDLRDMELRAEVGSSRVDLQACKLEYSIVSPK